jgi:hypothetical protein
MRFISQQEWDLTKCGDTRLHGLNSHVASRPEDHLACRFEGRERGSRGKPHAQFHGVQRMRACQIQQGLTEVYLAYAWNFPRRYFKPLASRRYAVTVAGYVRRLRNSGVR